MEGEEVLEAGLALKTTKIEISTTTEDLFSFFSFPTEVFWKEETLQIAHAASADARETAGVLLSRRLEVARSS